MGRADGAWAGAFGCGVFDTGAFDCRTFDCGAFTAAPQLLQNLAPSFSCAPQLLQYAIVYLPDN